MAGTAKDTDDVARNVQEACTKDELGEDRSKPNVHDNYLRIEIEGKTIIIGLQVLAVQRKAVGWLEKQRGSKWENANGSSRAALRKVDGIKCGIGRTRKICNRGI